MLLDAKRVFIQFLVNTCIAEDKRPRTRRTVFAFYLELKEFKKNPPKLTHPIADFSKQFLETVSVIYNFVIHRSFNVDVKKGIHSF